MRYYLLLLFGLSPICALAQKPLIVSSASMIQDIASNIGGDRFEYRMIVPIGGDPHIYEPTPSDAQLCSNADLILKNGLTFEGWIGKLIANSGSKAPVATVSEGVVPIASTVYANATDPHAWMDAGNGIIYATNIAHAMIRLQPSDSVFFKENLLKFKKELEELDAFILSRISEIPEQRRILITSHDAFHYYGKKYGLRLESILGTSTDADVQTADIRRLNTVIAESDVPAVFIESTVNPRMLEQIARDNQITVGGKLFADSLSDKDGPAPTYVEMLRHNTNTIYDGLMSSGQTASVREGTKTWMWALLFAPVIFLVGFIVLRVARK